MRLRHSILSAIMLVSLACSSIFAQTVVIDPGHGGPGASQTSNAVMSTSDAFYSL